MNWIQIFVAALFAMNLTHHMALNKMTRDILNIQLNISSQNESLAAMVVDILVSDNSNKFVKNQMNEIHLRMAAYENTN